MSDSLNDPWGEVSLSSEYSRPDLRADAGLNDPIQFVRAVTKLTRQVFQNGELVSLSAGLIPVVLCPQGSTEVFPSIPLNRAPMLDGGYYPLEDRVWFVNHLASDGFFVEGSEIPSDGDLLDVLEASVVKDLPAALIEARGGLLRVRFYPDGFGSSHTSETIDLLEASLSYDKLKVVLDDIYERDLKSPSAQIPETSVWAAASAYRPHEDAEARVQTVLKSALKQRFLGFDVYHEQSQVTGRIDLVIDSKHTDDPSVVTRLALLELKVLRDRSSGSTTYGKAVQVKVVKEGYDQTEHYKAERRCRLGALCIYDARKDRIELPELDILIRDAPGSGLRVWLWRLYADHREMRREPTNA